VFNQSLALAASCAVITMTLGFFAGPYYVSTLGASAATVAAGIQYLHWFLPSLALQFAVVSMGSALRGTGIVQPTMIVQVLTVVLNAILAPVLIAGWGTGHPMGVAGAGLASSISLAVGVVMLALYFHRLEKYVGFIRAQWRPQMAVWRRLLRVGLPAGGEFLLMFVVMAVLYWVLRPFGPVRRRDLESACASCKACSCRRWPWHLPRLPLSAKTLRRVDSAGCGRPLRCRRSSAAASWCS
jgi:Na+-driven multidrug efflux pump